MDIKQVKEFPDYYASTNGDIYSSKYKELRKLRTYKSMSGESYHMVDLRKDNKTHKSLVHRLIANTFIDNPNNLPIVNHKDNNIDNNKSSNLEWCTQKHNVHHSYKTMDAVRNFEECVLIKDGVRVSDFQSINEACRYAADNFGASYASLNKYRKINKLGIEIVKKCND